MPTYKKVVSGRKIVAVYHGDVTTKILRLIRMSGNHVELASEEEYLEHKETKKQKQPPNTRKLWT